MTFSLVLRRSEQLFYRWVEEPIGVVVPFIAFLAVWLPPQMPDMFAGMDAPIWQLKFSARPFLFAFAATLLGLSAWFWTRAALAAHHDHGETDNERIRRKHRGHNRRELACVEWSDEWAPRIALLFAGAITVLPIMFAMEAGQIFSGLLGTEMISFVLVGALYLFVLYRTAFNWMNAFNAPEWMANFRPTRIIADAPFGWPFALLSLGCSAAALIFVGVAPELVAELDAPTSALAALAFAVGPLVIALAVMRGLVQRFIYFVRWIVDQGAPLRLMPGERERVIRFSNVLGVILLFSWFFSPPWVQDEHAVRLTATRVHDSPNGRECAKNTADRICRPNLQQALRQWADAHRRVSGDSVGRVPVVIVAAEGGASRAAVWLLSAMRMLDGKTDGDFGRHVFAISGVSGGSLGAETYARLLRARGREDGALEWEDPDVRASLASFATTDLLSATIATYFLNDMFGNMVGPLWDWAGVPDRNAALEGTFERMWDDNKGFAVGGDTPPGFLSVRYSALPGSRIPLDLMPHFFLNGTDVGSGKRVITSTIRWSGREPMFPDSADFIHLVSHDVSMATAVTNSARFPFISPAGRFVSEGPTQAAFQIIDGGYFENYGARTAWELARAIEDLNTADPTLGVVPIVVVVSNDLDADQAPRSFGGACRKMLEDVSDSGSQITVSCDEPVPHERCVEERRAGMAEGLKPQDLTVLPQSMAPIFGLAATRSAHGRDALNILRRDFCRASASDSRQPKVRFIHIALPKPDPNKGEAAPMNWVLNEAACDYMLNKAPWLPFNQSQAAKLKATLNHIEGFTLRLREADHRPTAIDCGR